MWKRIFSHMCDKILVCRPIICGCFGEINDDDDDDNVAELTAKTYNCRLGLLTLNQLLELTTSSW